MAAQKFCQNQKVFAKVRGYPPWPARIHAILDETPNRQKYQVYFYGTHETGNCKQDELFDYVVFKHKYGKGVKRKHFNEAMQEIELELYPPSEPRIEIPVAPSERAEAESTPVSTPAPGEKDPANEKDSDDEGNLVIDETPTQKDKVKLDNGKSLKRKFSATFTETPEIPPAEITSRSGRKIKPKKFSDGHADFCSPITLKTGKPKVGKEISNEDNNGKVRKTSEETLPDTNGDRVELCWENKQNSQELVERAEESELPKSVKKDFKRAVKKKAEEIRPTQQSFDEIENLELLKTEVQLLDADCRIKASLSLNGANCDECLRAMDEILVLKLNAVMLKKHPEVVETVKKLKKYVGNVNAWTMKPDEEARFLEDAKRIRLKADTMYNKFKSLFTIPNGKSFYEVYSSERELFQQKTQNLSMVEIYGTVKGESLP